MATLFGKHHRSSSSLNYYSLTYSLLYRVHCATESTRTHRGRHEDKRRVLRRARHKKKRHHRARRLSLRLLTASSSSGVHAERLHARKRHATRVVDIRNGRRIAGADAEHRAARDGRAGGRDPRGVDTRVDGPSGCGRRRAFALATRPRSRRASRTSMVRDSGYFVGSWQQKILIGTQS